MFFKQILTFDYQYQNKDIKINIKYAYKNKICPTHCLLNLKMGGVDS